MSLHCATLVAMRQIAQYDPVFEATLQRQIQKHDPPATGFWARSRYQQRVTGVSAVPLRKNLELEAEQIDRGQGGERHSDLQRQYTQRLPWYARKPPDHEVRQYRQLPGHE
jgi:hypothetical protein